MHCVQLAETCKLLIVKMWSSGYPARCFCFRTVPEYAFLLLITDTAHKIRLNRVQELQQIERLKLKALSSAETDLNSYLLCLPQLLFFSAGREKQTELQNCAMYRIALFFSPWLAFPPSVLSARLCFASRSFAKI